MRGMCFSEVENFTKAEDCLNKAIRGFEEAKDPTQIQDGRFQFAKCLDRQGRHSIAKH